jgi:mutator protein MutT
MTGSLTPPTVVTAAVVERDGLLLVTQRLEGTHLAGHWEFPGGKCVPGEDVRACLAREMLEELGVAAAVGEEIHRTLYAYGERRLELVFLRCGIGGEPQPLLGQQIRWVTRRELGTLQFPPADAELIEILVEEG